MAQAETLEMTDFSLTYCVCP